MFIWRRPLMNIWDLQISAITSTQKKIKVKLLDPYSSFTKFLYYITKRVSDLCAPFLQVKVSIYSQLCRCQFLLELCNWATKQLCRCQGLLQVCSFWGSVVSFWSSIALFPKTLKYWVGFQRVQSYLMGRCLFSLDWQPI